ncbi:DUF2147 domain-containing protein [Rheinheimera sp.]|uniref:DUF2147 domain-containing protein n=1 Tax=Rheinheimera sp. TaxID=1869214 RepID=UPI00307E9761
MKNIRVSLFALALAAMGSVQANQPEATATVTGQWTTMDDETGQPKSVVEIYQENGKLYGKVVEIFDPAKKAALCTECKGADKDQPVLGLVIIKGLSKDGDDYSDGDILDPKNGKLYSCTLSLANADQLNVRGYLGFSLLGRSQTWQRVNR